MYECLLCYRCEICGSTFSSQEPELCNCGHQIFSVQYSIMHPNCREEIAYRHISRKMGAMLSLSNFFGRPVEIVRE